MARFREGCSVTVGLAARRDDELACHRIKFAPDALVHDRYRADLHVTPRQGRAYARCEAKLLGQYAEHGAAPYHPSRTRIELSWLRRNVRDLMTSKASRGGGSTRRQPSLVASVVLYASGVGSAEACFVNRAGQPAAGAT